jgi:hypothetical protein
MVAEPNSVMAVVTEYRENSHADLILGRILEGYNFLGKSRPDLKLVSLYTHQVPESDWSRALAKKHDVLICDSIDAAIARGTNSVSVEGVLIIGENGNYATNEKGQQMVPRRHFFEQVTAAFQKYDRAVPTYHAKQLAQTWADAKWMVDRSTYLQFPLMAGSVLPLTWRQPALVLPRGCRIAEAVAVAHGDVESSGYLVLELLQCMVERRRGSESGVREIRYIEGRDVWTIANPPTRLLNSAVACGPRIRGGDAEDCCRDSAIAFVIDYCDGLRATALLLNGYVEHFGFAARLRGLHRGIGINNGVASCQFYLQPQRPFAHFDHLVHAIDDFVRTKHSVFPAERSLLVTGMLEAVMTSRSERYRPVATPHLTGLSYEPIDCWFGAGSVPS